MDSERQRKQKLSKIPFITNFLRGTWLAQWVEHDETPDPGVISPNPMLGAEIT